MSGVSKKLILATRASLLRRGRGRRLGALLERAGWTMDPATATVLGGAIAVAALLVGFVLGGLPLAVLLAIVASGVSYFVLKSP